MGTVSEIRAKMEKYKWKDLPVHPANTAPKMGDVELAELAKDIEKNGLLQPILVFVDNSEEANGAKGPFPRFLLDGSNRLAALKKIGIDDPHKARPGKMGMETVRYVNAITQASVLGGGGLSHSWETDCDPYEYHLALNIKRRHLTTEQKREEIMRAAERNPNKSLRAIAREVGVSHPTVAAILEGDAPNGKSFQTAHRSPLERALEVVKNNPDLPLRKIQELADVGSSTAQQARKVAGSNPSKKPGPKAKVEKTSKPKPAKSAPTRPAPTLADEEFVDWLISVAQKKELPMIASWLAELTPAAVELFSTRIRGDA